MDLKIRQCALRPTGVHSLPVELLARIFVLGAGYDYLYEDSPFLLKPNQDFYPPPSSFQILVSHVCRRWRQVALRSPTLWTTLHLREPVHLTRAQAYLQRCSASRTYLLDIVVDTVAQEDHIPGVTLCVDEITAVFDLIIPHVAHWRSFHLKIRDNECKLQARHYLGSCGPAPKLETLQLYHFEDYRTSQNLYLATYRPPVVVFSNSVPRLRNVSLIGVNLPWTRSPYLMKLHKLELALHPDNIRPSYDCWDRMLRLSPELQSLCLHYSGPKSDDGNVQFTWPDAKDSIPLESLSELSLTDLDPDYLCGLMERLYLPSVRKISWDLPDQDFSGFLDLITCPTKSPLPIATDPSNSGSTGEVGVQTSRSKISISSLVSDPPSEVFIETPPLRTVRLGPLPNLSRLETLVITALDCSLRSWLSLLQSLPNLKRLEVDFARLGIRFWKVLVGTMELDRCDSGSSKVLLLPQLQIFKLAGIPGIELKKEMKRRCMHNGAGRGLHHWIVKWSPSVKGEDPTLDQLAETGCWLDDHISDGITLRTKIRVDTFYDEDEEGEEELESEDECDASSSLNLDPLAGELTDSGAIAVQTAHGNFYAGHQIMVGST